MVLVLTFGSGIVNDWSSESEENDYGEQIDQVPPPDEDALAIPPTWT